MKIVCLTIRCSKSEIDFEEFKNFTIYDCYEVLKKYNFDSQKDSNLKQIEYISTEIINSKTDIMICDFDLEIIDIDKISEKLKVYNLFVNKIIVPNKMKRNKLLADGQEMYRNHNRWLDFYPGQIENIHNEREREIKFLKSYYENTETEILEL